MSLKNIIYFLIYTSVNISQALIVYSVSWSVLKHSSDKIPLAICLTLSSIIPYLLQRMFDDKFNNLLVSKVKETLVSLFFLAIMFFSYMYFIYQETAEFNYILISVASIFYFFITQACETLLSFKVLSQTLSANNAAKILGYSINTGALIGAVLTGVLIENDGMLAVLITNIVLFILAFICALKIDVQIRNIVKEKTVFNTSKTLIKYKYSYLIFALLNLSTASINILLIELVQKKLYWSVLQYGIIDAFASIGSVFGVYMINLMLKNLNVSKLYSFGLGLAFMFIAINTNFYAMCILLFIWGVFMSLIYVAERANCFDQIENEFESKDVSKNITLIKTVINSIAPLFISTIFFYTAPTVSLILVGGGLFLSLFIVLKMSTRPK